jgi:hypothetical protein
VTRYRWVAARKAEGFPTTMACRVATVSRQSFWDWRARQEAGPTEAERAEADLVGEIRACTPPLMAPTASRGSSRSWPAKAGG